jgi:hypothetical protein
MARCHRHQQHVETSTTRPAHAILSLGAIVKTRGQLVIAEKMHHAERIDMAQPSGPEEPWARRGLNGISVRSGSSGAGRSCHCGRASALTVVKASIPAFV